MNNQTLQFYFENIKPEYRQLIKNSGSASYTVQQPFDDDKTYLRASYIVESKSKQEIDFNLNIDWSKERFANCFDHLFIKHESDSEWQLIASQPKGKFTSTNFKILPGKTLVSFCPTYNLANLKKYINRLKTHSCVQLEYPGKSQEGRKIPLIKVSNENTNKKSNCLIVSRCHPYETAGNYCVEGMIDFLLSSNDLTAFFLDRYNFYFIPIMNMDGVANGDERLTHPHGADLNRDFDCNKKNKPGTENDNALVTHFKVIDHLQPELYINIHNWSSKFTDGLFCFDEKECEIFTSLMPDQIMDYKRWDKRILGKPTGKSSPGRYCREKFGTISFVLEFPWYGRTLTRMREVGKDSLIALTHTAMEVKLNKTLESI